MRKNKLILFLITLISFFFLFSCKTNRKKSNSILYSYDCGLIKLQHYSREIFPDSLMRFFPALDDRDTSFVPQTIQHSLFATFPDVKKSELEPLPWQYGERYYINNKKKYQETVSLLRDQSIKELAEYKIVYSTKQLVLQMYGVEEWPQNEMESIVYISELDTLFRDSNSFIMAYDNNNSLNNNDFRVLYSENCPREGHHGVSSGFTCSDAEQQIYYWVLAW